jgi:hypothetical protein
MNESGGAKNFIVVPPSEATRVMGYYSISPGAIEFARVPAELTKKLGRYEVRSSVLALGGQSIGSAAKPWR